MKNKIKYRTIKLKQKHQIQAIRTGRTGDLTRIVKPKKHELSEAHPFIKDKNTGKIRQCKSTTKLMEATKAHHTEWMSESPAEV